MRYRKLSDSGDYVFGNQQLDFYRDIPEAVGQAVMTRLRLFTGEWFLDVTDGTPYQIDALGKHTRTRVDPMIRDRILNTQGVTEIVEYESDFEPENRIYSIRARINTVYGQTEINGVL